MVLFLDFDGVLHPIPTEDRKMFVHVKRLEAVLREHPFINIVISSWWRASMSIHDLREYFSEDIRPRIVDVTPLQKELQPGSLFLASAKSRGDEILEWVETNGYTGPWIALDDDIYGCQHLQQLVGCDMNKGFDEEAEKRLRARIEELL